MEYVITLLQDRKEVVNKEGEIENKEKFQLSVSHNYPYYEDVPVMEQDCFLFDSIKGILPRLISNANISVDDIGKVLITIKIETKDKEN